ncbi:TetR/AcrR family transcriptional regulator [Glycomyces sp. MUSA5-2]|uniref:TetR/AcrR family transcriptional regulator n=1 Tax=Glycomyces sp. MUSA5-2 TaxID=2053002 RepID=UPI003009AC4A
MEFQRARSASQREQRRRAILETAAAMLDEMPVGQLSLNELSRRVGLAKSNVLRYFESREAVLLELLEVQTRDWVAALEEVLVPVEGTVAERGDRLAALLGHSLAERPVLCDLISTQAAVLEHNVSAQVVLEHKRASLRAVERLRNAVRRALPELGVQDAHRLVAMILLTVGAAWPHARPPEALRAAFDADPALAPLRVEFTDLVAQMVAVSVSGLLARAEDRPLGARVPAARASPLLER